MIGKFRARRRSGFTLMEILLVVGIVGTISGIVVVAVNPAEQLEKARDTKRASLANQLEKAFIQYVIKGNSLPSEVVAYEDGAIAICKQGETASDCINVDSLLIPDYIAEIPQDEREPNEDFSGFVLYKDDEGAPHVSSSNIIGWFPGLIGMWRFDEGGGTVSADSSGGGNHATLSSTGDGELVTNGGAETGDTTNFPFDGVTNTDSRTDTCSFYEEGAKNFSSIDFIPIDSSKTYNLEGWFKSYGAGGDSKLYFGYAPYDENKIRITHNSVGIIAGTETTLTENVSSTDTVAKIADCSNWYVYMYAYMAFDVDDSGSYNDLPNRNLSTNGIASISGDLGGYCEIGFNTTVGKSYPAGTKVRMHKSGGGYMYTAAAAAYIPTAWTKYSSATTGVSDYGTSYADGFWKGTKFVRVLFLANHSQDSTYKFRVDDISIKTVPATYTGPLWTSGQIGSALDFDGEDDYAELADDTVTIAEDTPWTLSVWIKPDAFGSASTYPGIFGNELTTTKYQRLYFMSNSTEIAIEDINNTGGGGTNKVAHGMSIGNWYHLTVVNDGSDSDNITFYVDGDDKGTVSMALTEWEIRQIGGRGGNGHKFDGSLDDVRIYNQALSAEEIQTLYEEGSE